eukprot:7012895-Lingulodinium_polyedra.AAC.1
MPSIVQDLAARRGQSSSSAATSALQGTPSCPPAASPADGEATHVARLPPCCGQVRVVVPPATPAARGLACHGHGARRVLHPDVPGGGEADPGALRALRAHPAAHQP